MKKFITILLFCTFATIMSAQSSNGLHFLFTRDFEKLSKEASKYWAASSDNPKYRDLYVELAGGRGHVLKLKVVNSAAEDVTEKCTFSSSNNDVASWGDSYTVDETRRADPEHNSADWGHDKGDIIVIGHRTEYYPKNRLQVNKLSDTPVILTTTYENKSCTVRLITYKVEVERIGSILPKKMI